MQELTPIEKHDNIFLKRDDYYRVNGVSGGKARTCWYLANQGNKKGLVTAGSRSSPQVNIVAHIARSLRIPCHIHTPSGELLPEVDDAVKAGAKICQHKAGYNNVIIARAREDAEKNGFTLIPFGMECNEAVNQTKRQVQDIPFEVKRIVVPVGSGMSLAGILHGLLESETNIPILGVRVGADPVKRLDKYAPYKWRFQCELVKSKYDYHQEYSNPYLDHIKLDPIYEAKCLDYLREGDLLWVVGIRKTAHENNKGIL